MSEALRSGHPIGSAGYDLSETLFGQLGARAWQKPNWLITEDGAAAGQVPYAALNDVRPGRKVQTILANHSLRVIPSELLLLLPDAAKPQRRFVGVADPVYNLADSRRARTVRLLPTANLQPSATLGRLALS